MRRLLDFIWWLLNGRSRSRRMWQHDLYSSNAVRDEELDRVRQLGGGRARNIYVIGSRASEDGVSFEREELEYWSPEQVETKVTYQRARRCGCGAMLAGDNLALGTCSVCLQVVCHAQGCSARCEACGALVCMRHSVTMFGHTFCSRHRIKGYWLAFWGLLE